MQRKVAHMAAGDGFLRISDWRCLIRRAPILFGDGRLGRNHVEGLQIDPRVEGLQTGETERARWRERRGQKQPGGLFSDAASDGRWRIAGVCDQEWRRRRLFLQWSEGDEPD